MVFGQGKIFIMVQSLAEVGLDFGIISFITLSTGKKIKYPQALVKIKSRISKYCRRRGFKREVKKLKTQYKKLLESFFLKTIDYLIANFRTIYIEDVHKTNMSGNSMKMPWRKFIDLLIRQAKLHNTECVLVSSYNTSKTCHNCKNIKKSIPLFIRTYACKICGISIDRDVNAARVVMKNGQAKTKAQ